MTTPARAVIVWSAIVLAALVSLGLAKLQGPPPSPEDLPTVRVHAEAARSGKVVTYTFTLENRTDVELRDIYIAGKVPEGATFEGVRGTPEGSGFRGFEGAGTPLQAAVWLAERLPGRTSLGPFTYQVTSESTEPGTAEVWVHWQEPNEGTAISQPIEVPRG